MTFDFRLLMGDAYHKVMQWNDLLNLVIKIALVVITHIYESDINLQLKLVK